MAWHKAFKDWNTFKYFSRTNLASAHPVTVYVLCLHSLYFLHSLFTLSTPIFVILAINQTVTGLLHSAHKYMWMKNSTYLLFLIFKTTSGVTMPTYGENNMFTMVFDFVGNCHTTSHSTTPHLMNMICIMASWPLHGNLWSYHAYQEWEQYAYHGALVGYHSSL